MILRLEMILSVMSDENNNINLMRKMKGLPPLVAQKKAFFMNFFKEN